MTFLLQVRSHNSDQWVLMLFSMLLYGTSAFLEELQTGTNIFKPKPGMVWEWYCHRRLGRTMDADLLQRFNPEVWWKCFEIFFPLNVLMSLSFFASICFHNKPTHSVNLFWAKQNMLLLPSFLFAVLSHIWRPCEIVGDEFPYNFT